MPNHSHLALQWVGKQQFSDFYLGLERRLLPKEEALVRLFSDLDYSRFNAERKRGSKYSALTMILLIVVAGTQGRFSSRQIEEFSLTNTFAAALKYANNEDFDSIVKARQQRIQLQQYPKA